MRMSDRFQLLEFAEVSDNMGGYVSTHSLIDPQLYACSVIKTTKEYVQKTFNIELINPVLLLTNKGLNVEKDFILIENIIYSIKSVNDVKNKNINSYILEKVGDYSE